MRECVNAVVPLRPLPVRRVDGLAAELDTNGYVSLGPVLTDRQVEEVVAYLRTRPCYAGHHVFVPDAGTPPLRLGGEAERNRFTSYSREDLMLAPHLVELATSPTVVDLATRHLGCLPSFYSLNSFWSFPGHGVADVGQQFHR
ncbi:MAG: hypothetical protein HQL40_08985, partial [Alphaproteobacteria bacterium]|nr:hypothetical protein [Alphaproteobacteria bacterium]